MPIDLIIEKRGEDHGDFMVAAASLSTFEPFWVPAIKVLDLNALTDLVDIGTLEIRFHNKADVVSDLVALRDWLGEKRQASGSCTNDSELLLAEEQDRIRTVAESIDRLVSDDTVRAWLG